MSFEHGGVIKTDAPINIGMTLESGQTFLWRREDREMFSDSATDKATYTVARKLDSGDVMVIRVNNHRDGLSWESTHSFAGEHLRDVFRLNNEFENVMNSITERDSADIIQEAKNECLGLRVVNEPLFPTLISFICSTQMRVERIHTMVQRIARTYGEIITVDGDEYFTFPTPEQLAEATKDELMNLKLGYRAEYVMKTADSVASESPSIDKLPNETNEARDYLQEYTGVGPKVADCVLLYGAGDESVVPVDTWIDQATSQYYPELSSDNRDETARALEELFGEYAGYAQAYLFHYMRTRGEFE